MTQENKYKSIPIEQINELTAIYKDYLYITRQHEQMLQTKTKKTLAEEQIAITHPKNSGPQFPWSFKPMTSQEKQEFEDFICHDEYNYDNLAYITLKHIKNEEDMGYSKFYAIIPYKVNTINMKLPSNIERYSIHYNKDGKLGDTIFYIDGRWKAIYINETKQDKYIEDFIKDIDISPELPLLINLTEQLPCDKKYSQKDAEKAIGRVYAEHRVQINENVILELLGSFAEKVFKICNKLYKPTENQNIFELAKNDGFILSVDKMSEYLNIRNFIRHQWDSLEDLGTFNLIESNKNNNRRSEYVDSYLKLCDKSIMERAKSYIDALYQMQYIMCNIHPDWLIRNVLESNNKFFQRVKTASLQMPGKCVTVELNYHLEEDKYNKIKQHLSKYISQLNILDDFPKEKQLETLLYMNQYVTRSIFLQTFAAIECMVMKHCITRGRDLDNRDAWRYIKKTGIISEQEYTKWYAYGQLRNTLSHSYFNHELREKLLAVNNVYSNDFDTLRKKLSDIELGIEKKDKHVYRFFHDDGIAVELDYKKRTIMDNAFFFNKNPQR